MYQSKSASLKECQYCNRDFVPRRSDAKFCSSKCRNDFGNAKKLREREEYQAIVGETHKILWDNRNILLKYIGEEVSIDTLKAIGFDHTFHTQIKNKKGKTHYGFYDVWCFSESSNQLKIYQNE